MISIVKDFGIVCIERPGSNPDKTIEENKALFQYKDNILIYRIWLKDFVSSTVLRTAIKNGSNVKYLTPNSVVKYIEEHSLYSWVDLIRIDLLLFS